MAERSSFFNSINKDRTYKAEDWARYFATFISNGVFPNPANQLMVVSGTGMEVTISPGAAFLNGYRYEVEGGQTLTVDIAPATLKRVDRVVVRWGREERKVYGAIVKGAEATNPTGTALTRNDDFFELCLAEILVEAGVTEITQSKITDTRQNKELCGLVGWMVNDIDFTGLFAQYDAYLTEYQEAARKRFEDWIASLEAIADENLDSTAATIGWVMATFQMLQIADEGDFFTTKTVEGALQQLGGTAKTIGTAVNELQTGSPIAVTDSSYTLSLKDTGCVLQVTLDSLDAAATITVPAEASVPFAVGTEMEIVQWGQSPVVIAAASGVTINSTDGMVETAGQYASVTLKKMGADLWLLGGALA